MPNRILLFRQKHHQYEIIDMNSPGFDLLLLKAIRYQFFLDHDGRYPTILLLNPADFERLQKDFTVINGVATFLVTRVIQSMDIDYGTFEFYLNLKAE